MEVAASVEYVRFYSKPVVDREASTAAGCTKHRDGVYVRISNPGDRTLVVDRPKREFDERLYPREWLAFKAGEDQEKASGTLISVWGVISPAQVEDLRVLDVVTVEQLAAISDSNVVKLGGLGRQWRQQAKDFLEAMKSRAPVLKLQAEMSEKDEQLAALRAQVEELTALVKGIPAPAVEASSTEEAPQAPKRRGRPPKVAQAEG